MTNEYLQWLHKHLDREDAAAQKAFDTYQMTGMPRYLTAFGNHERTAKALRTAIAAETGRDEAFEAQSRLLKSLAQEAERYKSSMPPDEALDRIINSLRHHGYFGGGD